MFRRIKFHNLPHQGQIWDDSLTSLPRQDHSGYEPSHRMASMLYLRAHMWDQCEDDRVILKQSIQDFLQLQGSMVVLVYSHHREH